MKKMFMAAIVIGLFNLNSAQAQNLLSNGTLDVTVPTEIVPGFFLPKPDLWENEGSRTITGPYEDEMSSEPWAGPAPTPVTTEGAGGSDWAVFFKPFSGNTTPNGLATGHLFQDVPGTAGQRYLLTGWAGAEANALMRDAVFAIDFLDAGFLSLGSSPLSLLPTLTTPNGQAFNYKKYSVSATAPAGTAFVRARASMIDAQGNPAAGGQAFVVDDFSLTAVPEPSTIALGVMALAGLFVAKRRR